MAKEKPSWQLFIKKLIIYIIYLLLGWGIGSNFVYMCGRSKPNSHNNYANGYNPGLFDWPFHKDYMPYSDRDPINSNLEDPMKKKLDEVHAKQKGGGSGWNKYLEKTFQNMSSSSRKRKPRRKNRSRRVQKGGDATHAPAPSAPSAPSAPPANATLPEAPGNNDDDMSTAGKFLGLDLNNQEEIIKKVYQDFEKYYSKGYGGESVTDKKVDSQGRKVENLGILGKLYLNFDLTNNKYGAPYSWQNDGRESHLVDETTVKNPTYNDGSLFSDDTSYNPSSSVKSQYINNNLKKSQTATTTPVTKPATTPANEESSNVSDNLKGGGEHQRKKLPPTLIEGIWHFLLQGGWIKLFTQGAPDHFAWVQEKSWIFHRSTINKILGFFGAFFVEKPSGIMWLGVLLLGHFGPLLMAAYLAFYIGFLGPLQTGFHHYKYCAREGDNHFLTGWLWAGNFLFLPQILTAVTCWIPVVNIIVAACCLVGSIFPSIQTMAVSIITPIIQTIRSLIYISIGHLFTKDGSQFWKGNMFGEHRYRGVFIMELAIVISLAVQWYLPYSDSVKNGASMGVIGSWILFQLIVWMRNNSGWKGFWVDPSTKTDEKK